MAFVPGFEHDIFVSYALEDDRPPPGLDRGWVSALVDNLQWRLLQLSGRGERVAIWMPSDGGRGVGFAADQLDRVKRSALLLIIASPAYLESLACQRERADFLRATALRSTARSSERHLTEGRAHERRPVNELFVIERQQWEPTDRPADLADVLAYPFWTLRDVRGQRTLGYPQPDLHDEEYYARIDDLARDLFAELARRRQAVFDASIGTESLGGSNATSSTDEREDLDARPPVFLAEVTDDLEPQRDAVRRYLNQAGWSVLPDRCYPNSAAEYGEFAHRDMKRCDVFVQLLGELPGRRLPGQAETLAALQARLAREAGCRVLQWRSRSVDLERIVSDEHLALLRSSTVVCDSLAQFQAAVVRAAQEQNELNSQPVDGGHWPVQRMVFVNRHASDAALGEQLRRHLEAYGCTAAIPLGEGRPDELRQDLEANLLDCDGLLIVQGHAHESWARQQWNEWRRVVYRREKPLLALAVCVGPPQAKATVDWPASDLIVVDAVQGLDARKLEPFVRRLEEGVAGAGEP